MHNGGLFLFLQRITAKSTDEYKMKMFSFEEMQVLLLELRN